MSMPIGADLPVDLPPKPAKAAKSTKRPHIEWEAAPPAEAPKKPKKARTAPAPNRVLVKLAKAWTRAADEFFPDGVLPKPDPDGVGYMAIVAWFNDSRILVAAALGILASDLPVQALVARAKDATPEQYKATGDRNRATMAFVTRHVLLACSKIEYWCVE